MSVAKASFVIVRRTALLLGILLFGGIVQAERAGIARNQTMPIRTFKVPGVHVSLKQMEAFNAALVLPEPQVVPFLEAPDPFPLPGLSLPAAGSQTVSPRTETGVPSVGAKDLSSQASPDVSRLLGPPLQSFPGMSDTGWIPPDTQGAAGPAHLVSVLNGGFAIFDKASGAVVSGPISLQAFWGALGTGAGQPAQHPFDPKVLYDQYSGRFVVISDGTINVAGSSWVLVAVSTSSDPTAGFTLFAIDADATSPGRWADNPGLGVDPTSVFVTNNMFTVAPSPAFSTAKVWVIDKTSLLAGGPLVVSEFLPPGFACRPAHAFGATAVDYIISANWTAGGTSRYVRIQSFSYPGPLMTDLGFIQVADYGFDSITSAAQPGCAQALSVGDTRLNDAVLRDGRLWATHHVDDPVANGVGKTEVAWYEIDPAQASLPGPYLPPVQQGRVSAPGRWYYYPSIAVNTDGCAALGFSGSDAVDVFAGAYYTSRKALDAPGTMGPVVLLKAGESPYYKDFGAGSNRWGDYSATSVDPTDDRTFWTLQEYAKIQFSPGCPTANTGLWGTWWGSFKCECLAAAECADGVFCNGVEGCVAGGCQPGTPPTCDDANSCTADTCNTFPTVFSENFETGAAGWTHSALAGGADTWHPAGASCFGNPFPSTRYVSNGNAGPACIAISSAEHSRLLSPLIVLPPTVPGASLTLSFDALSFDAAGSCLASGDLDAHDVGITVDGGTTYTLLNNCSPLADGSGAVLLRSFDISAFAGQTVQVEFVYDNVVPDTGGHTFAVDNVTILRTLDACFQAPLLNGALCNDGNATTCGDVCTAGVCGGTPVAEPPEIDASVLLAKTPTDTTIGWTDTPGPYDVYRGSKAVGSPWVYNQTCMSPGVVGTTETDTSTPPVDTFFYYLVSRVDQCQESILGKDSANATIPNGSPCPTP